MPSPRQSLVIAKKVIEDQQRVDLPIHQCTSNEVCEWRGERWMLLRKRFV